MYVGNKGQADYRWIIISSAYMYVQYATIATYTVATYT